MSLISIINDGVTGVKSLVKKVKTGKAAIQAGFTVKGGTQTDAARAANAPLQSVLVYVWGIAFAFLVGILALLFKRK